MWLQGSTPAIHSTPESPDLGDLGINSAKPFDLQEPRNRNRNRNRNHKHNRLSSNPS